MFTVQYPRLLFKLPITRTPHNSNFQFRLRLKVRVIGSRLYLTSTVKWHIDLLKTWSSKVVIIRVLYNVFKLFLFFQTYAHVRRREMLLLLLRVHWQKVANQTCVSRLTKKLMGSHLSRRARKTLTVKASDHWQKVANQTCVSRLTKKLMGSHISKRAQKTLTVKASELLLSVQPYPHFLGGEMRENLHHLHRPG